MLNIRNITTKNRIKVFVNYTAAVNVIHGDSNLPLTKSFQFIKDE